MRADYLLEAGLISAPEFSNYAGGNSFTYQGKVFRRKKGSLGHGASGDVFCFEANDHTKVVVKVERSYYGNFWCARAFQKEAAWNQKIYGLGVFSGDAEDYHSPHYILMPYFEGKTLDKLSYASTQDLLFYWIKTADAVQTLHAKHRAVHSDLKSDNIIVNPDKKVFAIDFGLMMGPQEEKETSLFDTPFNKQRFRQCPPEVFSNRKKTIMAHPSQDIYALGILLYELLSLFLETHFSKLESRIAETITDVQKNLTHEIPSQRWAIAKAIYLLATTFFSQIPRDIWIEHMNDINFELLNHINIMKTLWHESSTIAIAVRINELMDEQVILHLCSEPSKRKTQKIEGLRAMHSEIQVKNPEQFGVIVAETKKAFPELMAGIFSKRTKILVNELSYAAAAFH